MHRLYGIPNCDTVRKARRWLDQANIDYQFINLREQTPDESVIKQWCQQLDWQTLLNIRSRTWRELPAKIDRNVDEAGAIRLMHAYPTLIKRPILESQPRLLVGFKEQDYREFFETDT